MTITMPVDDADRFGKNADGDDHDDYNSVLSRKRLMVSGTRALRK